ncbi:unnamed protein product [Sphenostylis stenocarpa]|uniref:Uncharacterized protein n=1 Tax=Sphenostylis stenocarpa TaxID=92480 RepID=A0AA86SBM4_9FABA|nr:unnamed protein product [Sphenostylis stenocarpa]
MLTDDDDFHGPVSASFIRPERLSDSGGASDDVTMDSTVFSMHYRSIARSDSGDINTRQLGLTSSSSHGSFMEVTEAKRPFEVVLDAESASGDSNDMSIEGEHQRSYQFDRVSRAFDALLAEVAVKDSPQHNLEGSASSPVTQLHQIQPSVSSIKEIKEFSKETSAAVLSELDSENPNRGTPLEVNEYRRQVLDSDHKSRRKQLSMSSPDSFRRTRNITPPIEQSGLLGPEVRIARGTSPSSGHRSILKMKTLEATPTMLDLKEGMNRLKARLSKYSPGFSLSDKKDPKYKQDESCQTPSLQEKLFKLTPESNIRKGLVDSNDHGIYSSKNNCKSGQHEEILDTKVHEKNLILISDHVSYNDRNPKPVEMETSSLQMTHVTKVVNMALADTTAERGKDEIPVPSPSIPGVTTWLHSLQDPSKGNLDDHGHDNSYHSVLQVAQSALTLSGVEISSGKKRKGVEMLSNGDNIDKIDRIHGSPEVHENGNGDLQLVLEQTDSMRSEREKLGDQTWNDDDLILKKFLAGTNQLLPPLVDKLNLRLIGRLEDILIHQQKVKKFEILCSEIQSQHTTINPPDILRDKRIVETRILLYNIAYEKAKLQLLHVKRDKLLKKVQQISSGLQECELIKLNFIIPSSSKSWPMDTQADDSHIRTKLFNSQGKCQIRHGYWEIQIALLGGLSWEYIKRGCPFSGSRYH